MDEEKTGKVKKAEDCLSAGADRYIGHDSGSWYSD